MAKSSMKAREDKRAKTVAKFAAKRDAIKVILNDVNTSEEDRWDAQMDFDKSCLATQVQCVKCVVVKSQVVHMRFTVSSAYRVSSFVKLRCVVMYQGLRKHLGKKLVVKS